MLPCEGLPQQPGRANLPPSSPPSRPFLRRAMTAVSTHSPFSPIHLFTIHIFTIHHSLFNLHLLTINLFTHSYIHHSSIHQSSKTSVLSSFLFWETSFLQMAPTQTMTTAVAMRCRPSSPLTPAAQHSRSLPPRKVNLPAS